LSIKNALLTLPAITMIWKFSIISIFVFLCALSVQSQSPCIIKHYSTDNGLSHSGVMCMLEDHNGFMWFGTWDGLNKFDGYTFTHYKSRPGDSIHLSHNRIDQIKEDHFGFLWVKTYDEKVHRFDRRTETFQGIPHGIKKFSTLNISIKNIYETKAGEMWLNAKNIGCFRVITEPNHYSCQVTHYSSNFNDNYLISNNNVNFIFEDSEFNLWVGTEKGLNCILGKHKKNIDSFLQQFATTNFTSVFETEQSVWFGTSDGRLVNYSFSTRNFSKFIISPSSEITAIAQYEHGLLCVGSKKEGLFIFNILQKSNIHLTKETTHGLIDNNIRSLYVDKYGLVWIETANPGVIKFDPARKSFKRFVQKTDKVSPYVYLGNFYNIHEDINHVLWINLTGGGFGYYNRAADQFEYFYNKPGASNKLFSNLVTCSLYDSYGDLWLSTYSRGIEKISFTKNKFRLYEPANNHASLSANEVRSIFEDGYENLWIGTREGKLYCYDKARKLRKIFSSQTKGPDDISFNGMVYEIIQDKQGVIWLGTKGDGIIKATFKGNPANLKFRIEHFRNDPNDLNSLSNNFVYSLIEDSKKRIWVGTFGGGLNLVETKNGKTSFKNLNNSFVDYPASFNKIRHLQEDSKGQIWVGTSVGLVIFDPNKTTVDSIKFSHFQKRPGDINSLSSNDVHYIFKDKFNQMWVGTFGGGLNKVIAEPVGEAPPKFKTYNSAYDLPVDIVLGIQQDNLGHLWLTTEKGLSMFNPQKEIFLNFSELDGLRNSIFSEAACFRGHSNELYFGCSDGYYAFQPDSIDLNDKQPPLSLINLQLFNKNVKIEEGSPLQQALSETKSLTLKYNQSVFSIEYAGLDYRNPERLEYAFILEGFEKEWNYVRKQRKATYTNLPAGNYTFRVKCSSTGVFDNKTDQSLKILILPPWWKTIWAYLAYAISLFFIFIAARRIMLEIIRLRNKVIIEQKLTELKIRFFTNISHELRTPLTLIIGPTEELMKKELSGIKTKQYLEIIDKNARRMLRHINQLLDFRKIQTGKMHLKVAEVEMVAFVKDIYSGFEELAASRNIDFKFSANISKLEAWVDMEKMDTAIFNLLSNAFKFTPENKAIEIIVNDLKKGGLEIIVKDQGTGIAKEDMPFLFERFAISHHATDLKTKGTGIGLSLVKEITDLHKGDISMNSTPTVGSTFTIKLKAGKKHFSAHEVEFDYQQAKTSYHDSVNDELSVAPVQKSETPVDYKEGTPLILIVEDNKDLQSYLANSLVENFKLEKADDGMEGWNKALSLLPDLIISDIMMPHMDGIELMDKLRNDFRTSHIPVILLTAKSSVDSMIEGLNYGADAYITKPFSMDYLMAQVSNLLHQRKQLIDKFYNQVKIVDLAPTEVIITGKDEQFLKDIIKIIEENLSNPEFNIEMIASKIGLGRTTFFNKLKGLTSLAPVEFLKEMRVKRGYQLLETGNFNIGEVAYQIGFSDAGYFSKCFKNKYHITPTQFLQSVKQAGKET
jgi:signal transduction histidine kinase/ligand-binding sensor domain-containing protein/DNA-binding response OmpR family regulator